MSSSNIPRYYRSMVNETRRSAAVEKLLSKHGTMTPEQMQGLSPVPTPKDPVEQAVAFFMCHFNPNDLVSFCRYRKCSEKYKPPLICYTARSERLVTGIRNYGVGHTQHGYLARVNPVSGKASGKCGCHKDCDVTAHRNILIENDRLPINVQLRLYAELLPILPIASLVLSGGRSVHAILRVNAPNKTAYRNIGKGILSTLSAFDFDPCTINPSRLTRVPGSTREYGAGPDNITIQQLVYLNPSLHFTE